MARHRSRPAWRARRTAPWPTTGARPAPTVTDAMSRSADAGLSRRSGSSASTGTASRLVERADGGPSQVAEVGAAAQRGAEVGGERPDVGARRARHLDRERAWLDGGAHGEAVDGHRAGGALDLLALAGQLVEATTVDVDRRDHRRDLEDLAGEPDRGGAHVAQRWRRACPTGPSPRPTRRAWRSRSPARRPRCRSWAARRGTAAAASPGPRPAAAPRWRRGRGCRSAPPCGCRAPPRLGHDVVAGPAGRLVHDGQAVGPGGAVTAAHD